ncbi:S-protein homolog 29-like [Macadamia integrifolia]|uniref:S-protein homolog 29-like n=1 Tax=Macadamia integrifolia TaxID=60698 RepID=UPI001C528B06|nr:S-protein homolog 29-like [Macadamia integrifolia]
MGGFTSVIPVLIILAMMMEYSSSSVSGCFTTTHKHVRVKNMLAPGKRLHLQCQSKNDDFGEKALYYNQEFTWDFCDTIFTDTLYYCDFWYNRNGVFVATHADVYFAARDTCRDCMAIVKFDGVHVVDKLKPSDDKVVAHWPK